MKRGDTEAARRFRENMADPRHGTSNGYNNLACRCPRCTEGKRTGGTLSRDYKKAEGYGVPTNLYLAERYPVSDAKPDPFWWHHTGQEWLPRWGEEMLGDEF